MYDVAVVGAGPAGSAAALSARRAGASVLLLDKAAFPRDKSCGDGIAPHSLDELVTLGAGHVLDDRVQVHRLSLRSPSGSWARTRLQRPDHVVPRELLDARLVACAVDAGAELLQHTVRTVVDRGDHVVLDGELAARVVIGADGANGVVRRALGVPRQEPGAMAVAVRGYAPSPGGEPEQVIAMDGRDWPSYAWRFDAGDGTSNVGFGMLLPSLRANPSGKQVLHERMVELLPETAGAVKMRSHHLPLSTSRPVQPRGRVLLVGDAASLVNPLTGEGIFYALLSGRLAGAAWDAVDPGASYGAALARELGRHLRHTTLLARLTADRRVLEAGVRAADRSTGAMDALVEVGLGRGLVTAPLVRAIGAEALRSIRRRLPI